MKRPVRIDGDAAYVTLTQGYVAVIDAEDAPQVGKWNWYAWKTDRRVYAIRTCRSGGKQRTVLLHRSIMGETDGLEVDHLDGDGLNNRRGNLRLATKSQNQMNARKRKTSAAKFKGVTFEGRRQKWVTRICKNGAITHLGYFKCQTAAAVAYAKASRELHGEFGRVA